MKHEYIDLMEEVFSAYKKEDVDNYINSVKHNGLSEHAQHYVYLLHFQKRQITV